MTPKIPPSFDGQSSWFEFEGLIDDWVNITTLTAEKLGPSLKNALTGNAEYYKKMLDNEQLRHERNGVTYFKETLIQTLRHESNTGNIDDLSHVASEFCFADPLTKHTAKPDELVRSIETGTLRQVDKHPPFRTLVKHKAFVTEWVIKDLPDPQFVLTFFDEDISDCVYSLIYAT